MRGVFALPLAVFVLGVPAGLVVWLNGPSTDDHGMESRTQYVKMIAKEIVPLEPPAEEPRKNIDSSEASGERADAVPERRPETALSGAPKQTATVDNDHETVGSVGDKGSANGSTTANDELSGRDPKSWLKAKATTDGLGRWKRTATGRGKCYGLHEL